MKSGRRLLQKIPVLSLLLLGSHCAFAAPINWGGSIYWPLDVALKKGVPESYQAKQDIVFEGSLIATGSVKVVCANSQYSDTNDFAIGSNIVEYNDFYVTVGDGMGSSRTSDGRLGFGIGVPVRITIIAKNQSSSGKERVYCAVADEGQSTNGITSVSHPMIIDISYKAADMPSISVSSPTVALGECRIGQSVHGDFDVTTNVTGGGNTTKGTLAWSIRQMGDKYHVVPPPKLFIDNAELVSDGTPRSIGVGKNNQHKADVTWQCAGIPEKRRWVGTLTYTIE